MELPPGSDAEALIGLDDVGQVGLSVVADDPSVGASALVEGVTAASVYHGPYFPGTTITWAQVADTSVALFEHGDDRAVIVGCPGGNVTLGLSGTDLTTVPTVDDIDNCG